MSLFMLFFISCTFSDDHVSLTAYALFRAAQYGIILIHRVLPQANAYALSWQPK